jgi:alkylation response protein AidB-like acyl-CoA dehydrogenase
MDFELTEAQRLFQETARQFAENEIAPIAEKVDELGEFPRETIQKLAELGFMGIAVPQAYGGAGADSVCYVVALEEISRACASHGVIMSVNNSLYCDPLLRFGTEEQKRRFLTPVASGKSVGCFCLSEPGAGSDAANQQTTARREGDFYVVNGTKNFITNGNEAEYAIVFATVNKELKHQGICALVVERGTPGFAVARLESWGSGAQLCPARLRQLPGPAETCSAGERGVQGRPGRAGRGEDRHRRAGGGHRPGGPGSLAGLLQTAGAIRETHCSQPGHSVHAGRHGHGDRRGPPAHPQRRPAQGPGT